MSDVLLQLQRWYASQCDGDWEHSFGVKIDTLDNPGWIIRIDLDGTSLENIPFAEMNHGSYSNDPADWHRVWVESNQFHGSGDPSKLAVMLRLFLDWAERNTV